MKKLISVLIGATALIAAVGAVFGQTPPFNQCPPVGSNTSCAILVAFTPQGAGCINDPTQGPYDNIEDTMIGVQNNSNNNVCSLTVSGSFIFGLDGDGICSGWTPGPPACPYGPTGYEGPGTSFTITNVNQGTVNFTPCLAPGQSTYFSLEERIDCSVIAICGNGVLESGEECDPPDAHPACDATSVCGSDCRIHARTPACGDGCLDPGEQCDDGNNINGDGCSAACVIENHPPDCSHAQVDRGTLWPPNHKFVGINISGVTDPDGDPVVVSATGITQDEPLNGLGDGNTCPDGQSVGGTAFVRRERTGTPSVPGNGRVYAIAFTATDSHGATCNGVVNVCVPHDQGHGGTCIDDGQSYNSMGPCTNLKNNTATPVLQ